MKKTILVFAVMAGFSVAGQNFIVMPNFRVNMDDFRTMPNAAKKQFFADGPNSIMDQLAPSPILEKLLKNSGK